MIGLFDSGVGGLSVLRAVRRLLPRHDYLYFSDGAHIPYGPRRHDQVLGFAEAITRFLLAHDARLVVVACNTASAAALKHLRARFPSVPFVGMEPAVKPAAQESRSRVVGVLATPGTFAGELFASVVARFAQDVTVLPQTCPGLVEQIERGEIDSPRTESLLRDALEPLLARGIDTLVLGCTHYPLAAALIERICGPQVRLIDPAPAVARQVERELGRLGLTEPREGAGTVLSFATGPVETLVRALKLIGAGESRVVPVRWEGGELVAPGAS
jgi:glutamate racemase